MNHCGEQWKPWNISGNNWKTFLALESQKNLRPSKSHATIPLTTFWNFVVVCYKMGDISSTDVSFV